MFKLIVLTYLLIANILGTTPECPSFIHNIRVIGGENARIEKYPYRAALEHGGNYICGASIISTTKILTAAHCTYSTSLSKLLIRVATSFKKEGGKLVKPTKFTAHPHYNKWNIDNDVAVIILRSSLELGKTVRPIPLQARGLSVSDGEIGIACGWGRTMRRGLQLQCVSLPKVNDDKCRRTYQNVGKQLTKSMMCFGFYEGTKGIAKGDSGSAIVVRGVQVGIVSWAMKNTVKFPQVYAKVSQLRDFIDKN